MTRNYYQILQIAEDAGADEIKKAYRRLAMKVHPDMNRDDPKAEESFREITEAYGVLIDYDKRKRYDRHRERGFVREDVYQDIFTRTEFRDVFDGLPIKQEWLEKLLMMGRAIAYEAIISGGSPRQILKRSLVRLAAERAGRIFHNVMDIHEEIEIPHEIASSGGYIIVEYRPGFTKRRIKVNIPQNTKTGTVLRVVGMGRKNPLNKKGDLYLHVAIASS